MVLDFSAVEKKIKDDGRSMVFIAKYCNVSQPTLKKFRKGVLPQKAVGTTPKTMLGYPKIIKGLKKLGYL